MYKYYFDDCIILLFGVSKEVSKLKSETKYTTNSFEKYLIAKKHLNKELGH